MRIGQLLAFFFGCYTQRFFRDLPFRGVGIFEVEPDSPTQPKPAAPPIHPCPYDRDGKDRPSFY